MNLLYYPNELLETPCHEVKDFENEELHKLLDEMKDIMIKHEGMGLAANQLGLTHKLFIMKDNKGKIWEFINPLVVSKYDTQLNDEGCLSLPGVVIQIPRAKQIYIKAYDRNGEEFSVGAVDREAICIQHEMDHLDGVFFTDYLSRQQKRDILRRKK